MPLHNMCSDSQLESDELSLVEVSLSSDSESSVGYSCKAEAAKHSAFNLLRVADLLVAERRARRLPAATKGE